MSKLSSTNIKDLLISKLAKRFNLPPRTIEAVVNNQIQGMQTAFQTDSIFSLEMSGFGKWIFNHKKAQKKLEKNLSKLKYFYSVAEDPNITDKKRESNLNKLTNTQAFISTLKPKLEKCPHLKNTLT